MSNHAEIVLEGVDKGADEYTWHPKQYQRLREGGPSEPVTFAWDERQRADLATLFSSPDSEGPRHRVGSDLAKLLADTGWTLDVPRLEDAEARGEELLFTLRCDAPELYVLPWEVLSAGPSGVYLSDFKSALLRYSVPGLRVRESAGAPKNPGVLLASSSGGGQVSHPRFRQIIEAACQRGGVAFRELVGVDEASLEAALEDNPPSVLHLLCHGSPGKPGEPPRLMWGAVEPVEITAPRLSSLLRPHREKLSLVVLTVCGSGDGGRDALFLGSLAQELHRKGITNVVAPRYILSFPGAIRMVETLYGKLLGEGCSIERALIQTRATLLKPDKEGHSQPGDAYALQLYTHATEVGPDGQGERPVLSSYPFGVVSRPAPATPPPRAKVRLKLGSVLAVIAPLLVKLTAILRRYAEDPTLDVEALRPGSVELYITTTVDGVQRVLQAWRAGALAAALGFSILDVCAWAKAVPPLPPATGGGGPAQPTPGPVPAAPAAAAPAAAGGTGALGMIGAVLAGMLVTGGIIAAVVLLRTPDAPPPRALPAVVRAEAPAGPRAPVPPAAAAAAAPSPNASTAPRPPATTAAAAPRGPADARGRDTGSLTAEALEALAKLEPAAVDAGVVAVDAGVAAADAGVAACPRPTGSYARTCIGCKVSGSTLACECHTATGDKLDSSLDYCACNGHGVSNCNGHLTCGGCAPAAPAAAARAVPATESVAAADAGASTPAPVHPAEPPVHPDEHPAHPDPPPAPPGEQP